MPTIIRLTEMPNDTSFAPLGVVGYCLTGDGFLEIVWDQVELPLKSVDHTVRGKVARPRGQHFGRVSRHRSGQHASAT